METRRIEKVYLKHVAIRDKSIFIIFLFDLFYFYPAKFSKFLVFPLTSSHLQLWVRFDSDLFRIKIKALWSVRRFGFVD